MTNVPLSCRPQQFPGECCDGSYSENNGGPSEPKYGVNISLNISYLASHYLCNTNLSKSQSFSTYPLSLSSLSALYSISDGYAAVTLAVWLAEHGQNLEADMLKYWMQTRQLTGQFLEARLFKKALNLLLLNNKTRLLLIKSRSDATTHCSPRFNFSFLKRGCLVSLSGFFC